MVRRSLASLAVDVSEVCKGYWKFRRLSISPDRADRLRSDRWFRYWEVVNDLASGEPTKLVIEPLRLFAALAETAPDLDAMAYLGAGPLEDYLQRDDWSIEELDRAIRRSPNLRLAFQSARLPDDLPTAQAARLRELLGAHS